MTLLTCLLAFVFNLRLLNHWDNLDGTVERGYAGESIWDWNELPQTNERYVEYARINAALGINGMVLNNVNATPKILTHEYLIKVKALADTFRPYGIKVYLSVNFASPMALGGLPTADPREEAVREWWKEKAQEIYTLIPDFGGFLVKANSEGQPGPCDYGRTHADGANMIAEALEPYGGIVMWRAFVYKAASQDRAGQAYDEFVPLDGLFHDNVILQVKNGPIDFQPREPYHPLFTAMKRTKLIVEFQITQEYLGQDKHLVFLAPMWREFLDSIAVLNPTNIVGIAGVANVGQGKDSDYHFGPSLSCGHPFAAANWYAFGRIATNPTASSRAIAEEWLRENIYTSEVPDSIHEALLDMMLTSREVAVDYMMPLGLHHLFAWEHHYGPEPWCDVPGARADWLPAYYHRADSIGIGFDRTATGSNTASQYPEPFRAIVEDINTCPDEYLLWFHHVPWNHTMRSGSTLWEELCRHYNHGVEEVLRYCRIWEQAKPYVKDGLFDDVKARIDAQAINATYWRDACLSYFSAFSGGTFGDHTSPPQ